MRVKRTLYTLLFLVLGTYTLQAQSVIITTYAGNGFGASTGTGSYAGDGGLATLAELSSCAAVAFDGADNIYIADRDNNVIRKVSYSGIITTYAGDTTHGYSGDHGQATAAELNKPYGVAVDAPGNVYIADYGNNRIRKVGTDGVITTYAGTGAAGYSGDGGPATAAEMNGPRGIAVDQYGDVFFTEINNHVVREIDTNGTITTVAGNGTYGYSGNGGNATDAQLYSPTSVTVDVYGDIYIADYNNNVVRMVDVNGVINNFAGNHVLGNSGDGGLAVDAELHNPSGVSIYGHGDVYISDQGNNNIRKVDASGIISHVAGTSTNGYSGDGNLASLAQLSSPKGLAVDGLGRVYVADFDNNVIRFIHTGTPALVSTQTVQGGMGIYPNPAGTSFNVALPLNSAATTITVADMAGRIVTQQSVDAGISVATFSADNMAPGVYLVKAITGSKSYTQKLTIVK